MDRRSRGFTALCRVTSSSLAALRRAIVAALADLGPDAAGFADAVMAVVAPVLEARDVEIERLEVLTGDLAAADTEGKRP